MGTASQWRRRASNPFPPVRGTIDFLETGRCVGGEASMEEVEEVEEVLEWPRRKQFVNHGDLRIWDAAFPCPEDSRTCVCMYRRA